MSTQTKYFMWLVKDNNKLHQTVGD